MDSLLFIFGHLYKKDDEINKCINCNESKLTKIMRLLINGDSDEARVTMVSYNDNYRHAFNRNSPIDLYSALSDWMPIFSNLCQYVIHSQMSCNRC